MENEVACTKPLVQSATGIIPKKLYESLAMRTVRPVLYIRMHKAVILNKCYIVSFGRTVKKCLVSETRTVWRTS
jgi:hypothetical protein